MSTIFGVLKQGSKANPSYDENDELLVDCLWEDLEYEFEVVAFRYNGGTMVWKNSIAYLLSDDTRVWALDNTPQGIYTIWDIKREINGKHSIL